MLLNLRSAIRTFLRSPYIRLARRESIRKHVQRAQSRLGTPTTTVPTTLTVTRRDRSRIFAVPSAVRLCQFDFVGHSESKLAMDYQPGSLSLFLNPSLPLPEDLQETAAAPAVSADDVAATVKPVSAKRKRDRAVVDTITTVIEPKRSRKSPDESAADGSNDVTMADAEVKKPIPYDPASDPRTNRTIFVGNVALTTTRKVAPALLRSLLQNLIHSPT